MSTGELYSLSLIGEINSNQVVSVLGFEQMSATAGFQGQALIDAWQAGCLTSWLAPLTSAYKLLILRAADVVPGTAATVEETMTTGNSGSASGNIGANQVAGLISWRTARSGKSFRGRTYLAGVSNVYYDPGGVVNTSGVNVLNALITAHITTFGPGQSGPFRLAVISRYAGKTERPTPIATQITAGLARSPMATQRRRRFGVGS